MVSICVENANFLPTVSKSELFNLVEYTKGVYLETAVVSEEPFKPAQPKLGICPRSIRRVSSLLQLACTHPDNTLWSC